MGKRFIIVCGGTGGHLSPGIALAERLVDRGHGCTLVVSQKEIDTRLRAKYVDLDFLAVPGVGLVWSLKGVFRFVSSFVQGLHSARALIKDYQPDVIIAFGGFLSPPYILLGRYHGVYLALHESNRRPGKSIRTLSRWVDRVYLPEGVRLSGIPQSRIGSVGYPLRREIVHTKKDLVRKKFGIDEKTRTLVIIGGSQGAQALNEWVEVHAMGFALEGINVYCVTGPKNGAARKHMVTSELGPEVVISYEPFSDAIGDLFSIADLVISRAGAGSIAELTACLAPSILIPYPHAADQHQLANARYFEQMGACVCVLQSALDGLAREVNELIFNDWMLNQMRSNLRQLTREDVATEMMCDLEDRLAIVLSERAGDESS